MINCLAIDDEPLALQQLSSYIEEVEFLHLSGTCQSASEAFDLLKRENIDVMFVDINMPDLSGLDFVRSLTNPPLIVFTTAYSEYALDGYKVDALDYLLKPFSLDEFKRTANKVRRQYELINRPTAINVDDDVLFMKSDYKIVRIRLNDIRYIEGMSEYVKFYLSNEQPPIVVLMSMKRLEDRLPHYFKRIHRSYIINVRKIKELNKNRVGLEQNIHLPIGELYKENFFNWIELNYLK